MSVAGHGEGSIHLQAMKVDHRIPVSSSPRWEIGQLQATKAHHQSLISGQLRHGEWVTHKLRKQTTGAHQQQATARDQVTHFLQKRVIGRPSAAGHSGGSGHSPPMKESHQSPVSSRLWPRIGDWVLTL